MKGTIDPEGAHLLTVLYAYAKRHMHGNGQRQLTHWKITRAVERLIFLIALIARLIILISR